MTTRYRAPPESMANRHASGSAPARPLFFDVQETPPSVDLNTPRPIEAAYSTRRPDGLAGSITTWVTAVSGIPAFEGLQVLPPSSVSTTPPLKADGDWRRNILNRGRS